MHDQFSTVEFSIGDIVNFKPFDVDNKKQVCSVYPNGLNPDQPENKVFYGLSDI